jgi:hypothetical protein
MGSTLQKKAKHSHNQLSTWLLILYGKIWLQIFLKQVAASISILCDNFSANYNTIQPPVTMSPELIFIKNVYSRTVHTTISWQTIRLLFIKCMDIPAFSTVISYLIRGEDATATMFVIPLFSNNVPWQWLPLQWQSLLLHCISNTLPTAYAVIGANIEYC